MRVSADIQTSINQFLKQKILSLQNKWFCPSCIALSESTRETYIIDSAPILIIQLCRFSDQGGQLIKDANVFSCTQSESNKHPAVPITVEGEVSYTRKYSLITIINHLGTLNRLLSGTCTYLFGICNDKLVFNGGESFLNNTASYIPFYSKV